MRKGYNRTFIALDSSAPNTDVGRAVDGQVPTENVDAALVEVLEEAG
jgi:hypothetical protein